MRNLESMNDLYLFPLAAIQLPPFLYHYFYNTFTDTGNKHEKIFHTNKTYKIHTDIHTNIHTKFHTEMVKKIKQPLFRFFNKNKTSSWEQKNT